MPSSDDINSAFGDQWGLLFTVLYGLGLVLSGLGLPCVFLFRYYTVWDCLLVSFRASIQIGTAFSFPFPNTIRVWDCLPYREYYTGFGLVLSQVGSVPQMYLRSFEVEEKP